MASSKNVSRVTDHLKEIESSLAKVSNMTRAAVQNDANLGSMLHLLSKSNAIINGIVKECSSSSVKKEEFVGNLRILYKSSELKRKALKSLCSRAPPPSPRKAVVDKSPPQAEEQVAEKLEEKLRSLRREVLPENGLKGVVGLAEAKQLLTDAVVLPLRYNHLFTGARKPWSSILLYGPPGTGKTRLAHAVAAEVGAEFYVVTPADLLSKWFGETEQKIRDLFGLIKERAKTQSCIVFLDEVDGLCRRRSDGEAETTRRMKSELLNQLQESSEAVRELRGRLGGQLFFLCATNCPWDIDTAFLRRFQRRIFISLPDRACRHNMILNLSTDSGLELSDVEWEQLLDRTEGFSGSDIADLVKGALYQPLRELSTATHWVPGPGCMWIPCSSNRIGAIRSDLQSFPPEAVCARDVTVLDFLSVIANTHPTVSQEDLRRYDLFTSQFGQLG